MGHTFLRISCRGTPALRAPVAEETPCHTSALPTAHDGHKSSRGTPTKTLPRLPTRPLPAVTGSVRLLGPYVVRRRRGGGVGETMDSRKGLQVNRFEGVEEGKGRKRFAVRVRPDVREANSYRRGGTGGVGVVGGGANNKKRNRECR